MPKHPDSAGSATRMPGPVSVASLIVALGSFVVLSSLAPVSGFTKTHYLFTYQDGFVRRAFIGSLLAPFGPADGTIPARLGFIYLFILLLLIGVLSARAWLRGNRATTFLLVVLLLGASQLRILAYDVGKFDGLLLALTAAAAVITVLPVRAARMVVMTLAIIGVLVHELHLVAGVPLTTVMVATAGTSTFSARLRAGLTVIAPAALLGATLAALAGNVPGGSIAEAEARMAARAGFAFSESATFVQDLGVAESMRMTFNVFIARPGPMLLSILVAVPPALAAILMLRLNRGDRDGLWLVAAALSPVLLLPLGFDWYRWVTVAVVNLIIAGLWRQATWTTTVHDPASSPPSPGLAAPFLVLASVVLASISLSDVIANVRSLLVPD